MKLTGNTIFVTGGGSGIGRGLAETLHRLGNQVLISGRRKGHLAETTKANPGMKSVELDVEDPASIAAVTRKLIEDYPKLNVLINNAGVMHIDNAAGAIDEALLVSTIATNLMGSDSDDRSAHRPLEKAGSRRSDERIFRSGVCSARDGGGVLIHKGSNPHLHAVA